MAANEVDRLLPGRYTGAGKLLVEPGASVKATDLCKCEVGDKPAGLAFENPRSLRKNLFDVGCPFKGRIVQADEDSITGDLRSCST